MHAGMLGGHLQIHEIVEALRIVFTVDRVQRVVEVSEMGPRGQMYRRL